MQDNQSNNSRMLIIGLTVAVVIAAIAIAMGALNDDDDDALDVAASLNVSDVWVRATAQQMQQTDMNTDSTPDSDSDSDNDTDNDSDTGADSASDADMPTVELTEVPADADENAAADPNDNTMEEEAIQDALDDSDEMDDSDMDVTLEADPDSANELGVEADAAQTEVAANAMQNTVTGAFMTIENPGEEVDYLVSASVDASIATVVELHETTIDDNDVMQMRHVDQIEIPAGGSIALQPGSYHIMLIDVQRALEPGDTVALTLSFESGKTVTVDADVREMGS